MDRDTMLTAAADLTSRSFAYLWLKPGKKTPRRRGWTLAGQTLDHYAAGANLGILTGALSGDLVCVDFDTADALALAERHLPPTGLIDGRPGKPRSHWYYRVTDVPPDEVSDKGPGGGPKTRRLKGHIDFLGTGAFVVAPPSIWTSKDGTRQEARVWEADGEPATVRYADLRAAVDQIVSELAPPKKPVGRPRRQAPGSAGPPHPTPHVVDPAGAVALARAWFVQHESAVSGQDGRRRTFVAARFLVNDFALSPDDAWPILAEWNGRCCPPWREEELRDILARAAAADPNPAYPRGCKLDLARSTLSGDWNDPDRLARDFMLEETWRLWNGAYWTYTGTHYEKASYDDLSDSLWAFVQQAIDGMYARMMDHYQRECQTAVAAGLPVDDPPRKPKCSRSLVANVLSALNPRIKLPTGTRLPSMLGAGLNPPRLLAVQNGLLNLDTFHLGAHDPAWFSRNCIPAAYEPGAVCPGWDSALSLLLEDDRQRVDLLQEWFGYCLWNGHQAQKFCIIYGDGKTGKSTVLAALKALIGEGNYSAISFSDIGSNRFAYAPTLGMMLNVSGDTSQIDRFAEGPFKSFVTGESMDFEFKGQDKITARPTAKLVLATNVLPHFSDKTDGMWRRPLYLPFSYVIPREDRVPGMDMPEHWQPELPGILLWALAGLHRLRQNGFEFTQPDASEEIARGHRFDSDLARAFLLEHFTADPGAPPMRKVVLYSLYVDWCKLDGVKFPLTHRTFNRSVRQAFPSADEAKTRFGAEVEPHERGVFDCWLHLRQDRDLQLAYRSGPGTVVPATVP